MMKKPGLFERLLVAAILAAVLAGCSGGLPGGNPGASPTPTATLGPRPTHTPTLALVFATLTPEPTSSVTPSTSAIDPQVALQRYQHPDGLFEVQAPEGWVTNASGAAAIFLAPDNQNLLNLQVTNTGYELNQPGFVNFVGGREANLFAGYAGYQEIDRRPGTGSRSVRVTKHLLSEGQLYTVVTFYTVHGAAVSSLDVWLHSEAYDDQPTFPDRLYEHLQVDGSKAASLPPYEWVFEFEGPGRLFTIEVPISWKYELRERQSTLVESFYAPDEQAVIQNLVYDEGRILTGREVGELALSLLWTYYAPDIVITDDRIQPDGSERLTWYSPGGDYRGISFLEARGSTFLFFTVMYTNSYAETYFPVLEHSVTTYEVP